MINLPQLYKNFQGQTTIRFADIPLLGESIGVFFDTLTSGAALIVANVAVELTGPASKPESIAVTGETGSFGPDAPAVITVTFQQEEREQTISVSVDFEAQAAPSIAAFFRLIGGIDLSTYLPSPFNAFSDLGLRHVDTTYNVPDNRIESVGLTIQTSRSWDLLPKLTVENIELSAALDNPGDRNERTVTLGIEGDCSIGGSDANTIHVSATTSPYEARAELAEGEIALGDAVTLFMDASIDLGAALTKFDLSVQPAEHAYSVKADIAADQWELVFTEDIRFGLRKLAFEVARKNGNVTGGIEGKMHIGPADGGINLEVSAMHPEPDSGWIFAASMKEKETVPLGDLAGEFLQEIGGGDSVAEWIPQLDISDVSFKAALPPGDQSEKGNTYTVQGAVAWAFEYEGISFPSLRAEVLMSYNKAGTSGHIKGMAEFLGLEMALGYEFSPTDRSLFIEWEGFRGTYAKQDGQKTITFVMGDRSLGALIVALMRSIDADFRLSAPWNVLNDINLNGLSLVYKTSDDPQTSGEIAITYEHEIDLGFLTFTSLKLTKTKQAGVVLAAEGTFLGLKIGSDEDYSGLDKGRNVTDLPTVPGAGDALFQLKYLGLGQHVSLYPPQGLPNVDAATKSLLHVFKDPPPPEPGQPPLLPVPIPPAQAPPVSEAILIFNRNSHWLIGTQFVILQAITVSAIFNDPDLYGLLIEVGGDKFPTFKGLSFEILYKKITDSIGVFHLELQLPDAMRQLEFGAVSVTLPIVAVDIYTNGNFKLDFGFPYNMDFSRSMTVQAFPFTGSGGFYFAYLNSATSTRVPVTTRGRFDPVIEFGLGLQLGIGKDISKGIFKAGLSLTLIGIVEGVFGQYHPYPGNPGQDEVYYWLQGTLGLIGHIYGEVNFSIISARVDITVYAYAQITIECYRAIPIYLEAAVKVSLKVKINLGLFKITISLKFGITVTASFTIGSDSVAPWDELGQPASFALPASVSAPLTWPPVLVPDAQKETLTTYFLPHLTLSGEGDFPGARYVAMLYMDSPEGGQSPDNPISFERLANAVLVWVLNAVIHPTQDSATLDDVLNAPVSLDALRSLYAAFDQPAPPFTYEDITAFLRGYFKAINITGPDAARAAGITDLHATVFPMIPDLWLKTTLNGTLRDEVDFAAGANVTGDYRGKLRGLFAHMAVDYHRDVVQESGPHDHQGTESRSISMATAVFEDFFALIAKNAIQDAIDDFENYDQPVTVGTLLQAANGTEHAARIAGMSARYLLHGLRLPDPAHMATHRPLYDLTGQQVVVPSLKAGDQFSFTLTHAPDWIIFNGAALDPAKPDTARLAVMLDKAAISRANALTSIPFSPRLERGTPQPLPAGRLVERLFTLKSDIAWQYPDEQDSAPRTIWQLSPALLHVLQNAPPDEVPALTLHAATQSRPDAPVQHTTLERYDWATLVHVALRKIPPADNTPILAHTYEVIGADETSIVYLERLLRYLYAHGDREINQIRLLYRPAITGDSPQGLRSEQDFAYVMALVKGNLSTETNPPKAGVFALAMAPGEPAYNTLNTPQDFVTLLWQCSIVRSGGFYLYYHVHDGGGSLPDHLFADDGTGSISILVTYTRDGVGDFLNSVAVAEPTRDATLYARSDTLTSLVATVPPGHVGIAVERAYPGEYQPVEPYPAAPTAASQEQERRYLEHQFNLMGYKLEDSTAITAQDRALLPVGAVDDVPREDIAGLEAVPPDSDGSWSYRVVLPVARYARTFTPSRHEDILPARDNPYAGVGGSAALRLFWQDLFGNTADTALSNDTPIYYTDPLIGLSRWPGVTSEYTFATDSGSRQIHITLSFDTGRYENNGHNAQLDAITYRRTYYQLLQDDVQVSFRTTLDGSANAPGAAIPVDKTRLLDFVARIYRYLTDGTPLGQDQNLLVLTASITRHNSAHIFELAVDFTIKRTDHIAHEFAPPEADENTGEVSEVAAAITAIRPATRAVNINDKKIASLREFATRFETVFKDVPGPGATPKIAVGTTKDDLGSTANNKKVWVVRFDLDRGDNGIGVSIPDHEPAFFAPIPLANSDELGPLDTWGRQFLEAVDEFLAPEYATPAFLLDNGDTLQTILNAKQTLADAISGTVDTSLQPANTAAANTVTDIGSAQEKLKQRLLIRLADAYAVDAVVQHPVTVTSGFNGANQEPVNTPPYVPRLFGKLGKKPAAAGDTAGENGRDGAYTLSTAKIPLGSGDSWLTYLFDARSTERQSSFRLNDLVFQITHIEHQIDDVPGMGDYRASAWLSFVRPLEQTIPVGPVTVPIPLRAYPMPPALVAQQAVYERTGGPDQLTTIQQARQWDYTFTYEKPPASQDTIHAEVQFNIQPGAFSFALDDSPTLPELLAHFVSVYPDLQADFVHALAQIDFTTNTKTESFTTAYEAVQKFSALVTDIAEAWKRWSKMNARRTQSFAVSTAPRPVTYHYQITEAPEINGDATTPLVITISRDDDQADSPLPRIELEGGYKAELLPGTDNQWRYYQESPTGPPTYLAYQDRGLATARRAVLPDLDIINTQNAWAGVQIRRNEVLVPGRVTNPCFIYQTPWVRFSDKLFPLLACNETVDLAITGSKPQPALSLAQHLGTMLAELLKNADGNEQTVKLECVYRYNLGVLGDAGIITLPVLLVPPTNLHPDYDADVGQESDPCPASNTSFACQLNRKLLAWFETNRPGLNDGTFVFNAEVYGAFDSRLPLLRLNTVLLRITDTTGTGTIAGVSPQK